MAAWTTSLIIIKDSNNLTFFSISKGLYTISFSYLTTLPIEFNRNNSYDCDKKIYNDIEVDDDDYDDNINYSQNNTI